MLFTDLLKRELYDAANFYKVEVEADWNKERISLALLDAGHTPEQWAEDSNANDNGDAANEPLPGTITTSDLKSDTAVEDDLVVDEDLVEEDVVAEEPELVLVRFTGHNASYSVGRFRFTRLKPFALMTEEEFAGLDRKRFREATKAEAAEFYN